MEHSSRLRTKKHLWISWFRLLCMFCCALASQAFAPKPFQRTFHLQTTWQKDPVSLLLPRQPSTELNGIPKMFRWLTDQYPDILHRQLESDGLKDLTVDNFYLDMNGIIHPCTHGNANDKIVVLDETAMFKKIFLYVDRLYKLVRPKGVMYLAVDGVAPRAKMNQQRSRRFRSAKEQEMLAAELVARGTAGLNANEQRFDSNCITPGTDFMLKLSIALQKWVEFKMKTDPVWQSGADVIVSGPDIPGEGEHKGKGNEVTDPSSHPLFAVMDFIREQQQTNGKYCQPGTTHVLYGLDADLIMLGLVSHEPDFHLLREKMSVVMARGRKKRKDMLEYTHNDFEVLSLQSLRKMLALQFRKFSDPGVLKVPYSLERVIDDFVFLCMLIGNDFLAPVSHLEIDGGALSLMMSTYIDLLAEEWGDYLTDKEKIHVDRFEQFIYYLAAFEEEHFKRRSYEDKEPGYALSSEAENDEEDFYGKWYGGNPTPACAVDANFKGGTMPPEESRRMSASTSKSFLQQHPNDLSRSYRDFYYNQKFNWTVEDRGRTLYRRREQVREYIEGLHWNLNYYHNGCASWDWFFPYLYSPLATDIVNLSEYYEDEGEEGFKSFPFDKGTPFPSLAQLLSVLPPQSANLLPKPLGELMTHPSSPLAKYYPLDFTADMNGKRQAWEAIVQIPFIEADELLTTVSQVLNADAKGEDLLTNAERKRNAPGQVHQFEAPNRETKITKAAKNKRKSTTKAV